MLETSDHHTQEEKLRRTSQQVQNLREPSQKMKKISKMFEPSKAAHPLPAQGKEKIHGENLETDPEPPPHLRHQPIATPTAKFFEIQTLGREIPAQPMRCTNSKNTGQAEKSTASDWIAPELAFSDEDQ